MKRRVLLDSAGRGGVVRLTWPVSSAGTAPPWRQVILRNPRRSCRAEPVEQTPAVRMARHHTGAHPRTHDGDNVERAAWSVVDVYVVAGGDPTARDGYRGREGAGTVVDGIVVTRLTSFFGFAELTGLSGLITVVVVLTGCTT